MAQMPPMAAASMVPSTPQYRAVASMIVTHTMPITMTTA